MKAKKEYSSVAWKSNLDSLGFKSLRNKVDSLAKNTLEQGNINSLVIAIYSDGFVYQQYYPVIDFANKILTSKGAL